MPRSAVTDGFVTQYPQPWAHAEPCKQSPAFFTNGVIFDIATPTGDTIGATVPDEALEYEIDDVVLSFLTDHNYNNGVTETQLTLGLIGVNTAGVAKDAVDYLCAAATLEQGPTKGTSISVSGGDLTWAATADTAAERRFKGGFSVRGRCVDVAGVPTGTFVIHVRCHVIGAANAAIYPEIVDEPAIL